jgi:hypothetical protein
MAKPLTVIKKEAKNSAPRISINNHVIICNYSKHQHLEGAIGRVVKEPTHPSTWYTVRFGDMSEAYFRYPNLKLMKGDVTLMQCKDCLKRSFIATASLGDASAESARRSVIDRALDANGGIGINWTCTCKKANNKNFNGDKSTRRFDPHRREQPRSRSPLSKTATAAAATLIANSDNSDSNYNRYCNFIMFFKNDYYSLPLLCFMIMH